ncbi:Exosome complex component RRP42, partial [Balamuthia mandrillaris]
MFQVSSSEVAWVEKGVAMDLRSDGRGRLDYRHFTLETGVISQTNGSALLKLDTTDVLVGVKVDLGEPKPEAPDQGILRFSVECSPSISPEFEGRGGDELNVELASILARANHNALDLKSLCVIPGKLCWTLYVDAL